MTLFEISRQDVVYLAGPMSGRPDGNRAAFNRAEAWLKRVVGCEVLNPARQPAGLTYCEYMRRAISDIEQATCVILLPGYIASVGAGIERSLARKIGLPVYTNLIEWENEDEKNFMLH